MAVVTGLTVLAFALRIPRVVSPDGTMGEDQSRIALAAVGVLDHGYPRMPSGRTYYRGITTSYLIAGSIALFGQHDTSARLPSVLLGTLLVPVLFLVGRTFGGPIGGLSLATFGVFQPDLLYWSTDAWMSLPFVVAFVAAALLLHQGYVEDRASRQVAGACVTLFAILTHELGVLLPASVAVWLTIRTLRGDRNWYRGRPSAIALGVLALTLVVFVAAGLALRAGTLAGATAEFTTYFGPGGSLESFLVDAARFGGGDLPLALAAIGGLFLLRASRTSDSRFLYLTTAMAASLVWVLISKSSDRYGLVLVPLVATLAVWALTEVGARIAARRPGVSPRLGAYLVAGCFLCPIIPDARAAFAWSEEAPEETWLTVARELGWSPDDLVFSDNPPIEALHLGRVDYLARPEAYLRYSYVDGEHLRDVYAGAIRVSNDSGFEELVGRHAGRRLWYFGEERKFDVRLDSLARERLLASADVVHRVGGTIVLRVPLDRLRGSMLAK